MESPSMTYCNVLLTLLGVLSPEQAQNLLDRCRNWGDGLTRFLNEFHNCSGGSSVLSPKMSSFSRVNFLPIVLFKLLVITVKSVHKVALKQNGSTLKNQADLFIHSLIQTFSKEATGNWSLSNKTKLSTVSKHLDAISILTLLPLSKIQF